MHILLKDDMHPEDVAMLQALLSRSNDPVEKHLQKVEETGSGKFCQQFYVGYNHKSIADCGSTTLFFENVSMLAAKAIQDWPLYNGQETSTRFVDMSTQPCIDPLKTVYSRTILDRWMEFYNSMQAPIAGVVRERHPRRDSEDEKAYDKAVHARVQDILRAFLPARLTTRLSCHMNLRQFADHLEVMRYHPLEEVRKIAFRSSEILHDRYPSSGFRTSMPTVTGQDNGASAQAQRDAWQRWMMQATTYIEREPGKLPFTVGGNINMIPADLRQLLQDRPRGCVLPHFLNYLGRIGFDFGLNFGSFRDVQRHRNAIVRMPLLTMNHGFDEWHLEQLGPFRKEAEDLIVAQGERIYALECDKYEMQYYIPMGYVVPTELSSGLPGLVYLLEVRSAKTVHHTLRVKVHQMAKCLDHYVPSDQLAMHVDWDEDDWTVRRGGQTIERKDGHGSLLHLPRSIPSLLVQVPVPLRPCSGHEQVRQR